MPAATHAIIFIDAMPRCRFSLIAAAVPLFAIESYFR